MCSNQHRRWPFSPPRGRPEGCGTTLTLSMRWRECFDSPRRRCFLNGPRYRGYTSSFRAPRAAGLKQM